MARSATTICTDALPGSFGRATLAANPGLGLGLVGGLVLGLSDWLLVELIGRLFVGLLVRLNGGGGVFIRHFILRAQPALEGSAPFRYFPFLEYATTLLLLERNGGAYRFRHDLLREYFGSLTSTVHL